MFEWRVNGLGTLFINHSSLILTYIELEPLIHLLFLLLLLLFGDVTVDDDASDDSDGREAAEHAPGYGPRAATDKQTNQGLYLLCSDGVMLLRRLNGQQINNRIFLRF